MIGTQAFISTGTICICVGHVSVTFTVKALRDNHGRTETTKQFLVYFNDLILNSQSDAQLE